MISKEFFKKEFSKNFQKIFHTNALDWTTLSSCVVETNVVITSDCGQFVSWGSTGHELEVRVRRKTNAHISNPHGNTEIEPVMGYITSGEDCLLLFHVKQAEIVLTSSKSKHCTSKLPISKTYH